jgi:DNA-binding NarL/FixJ family response regulator
MQLRAGWAVDTLEVLHGGSEGADAGFGARALQAMAPALDHGCGLGFSLVDLPGRRWRFFQVLLPDGTAGDFSAHPPTLGFPEEHAAPLFQVLYGSPQPVSLMSALLRTPELAALPAMREVMGQFPGVADAVGLPSMPGPGLGLCAFAALPPGAPVSAPWRRRLTRLAFHLEAAVRRRLAGEAPLGEVTPFGRVELARPLPAAVRASVSDQVRGIERVRLRAHRQDDELALQTWRALVAGHLSLFERSEGPGQRRYHLFENPPRAVTTLALSQLEESVVSQVARGLSNKEVGYALGVHPSAVSRVLRAVAEKVGLSSGQEAVRVAALLQRVPPPPATAQGLTAAEQEVVSLLVEGLSNEEIARRRGTALRTVSNQVAAILRKTGASGRRAFLGRAATLRRPPMA